MNLNELQDRLMAVARKNPPGDHVPYAFEKRIMSRLSAITPPNPWAAWGAPLWRAAVSCVAITVLCSVWSLSSHRQADTQESFAQAFDAVVFTPPGQRAEDAW